MEQVVIQHFELQRVPQAVPGATQYAVHELPPQLTEGGCNLLADLAQDKLVGRSLVTGTQPPLSFLGQARGAVGTPIAQVAPEDAPVERVDQGQCGLAIIAVARRKEDSEYAPVNGAQEVEVEAKEPALSGFPKVRPLIPHQSAPPVPDILTEGKRGKAARQLGATNREVCLRGATSKTPCRKARVSTSPSLNWGWAGGEC